MRILKKSKVLIAFLCAVFMTLTGLKIFAIQVIDADEIPADKSLERSAADTVAAINFSDAVQYPQAELSYGNKKQSKKDESSKDESSKEQDDTKKVKSVSNKTQKKIVENFKVALPANPTDIYEFEPEPLNFYYTRDYSNEYYTVYDLNSGKRVTLNAFELVCRIVNNEISDSWGSEAIKAQAVAAYSYVRFYDESGSVPSVGLKSGYSSIISDCVHAVEGQAVTYNGSVINAVYSASTAGCTVESGDVWGVQYPYLRAVESVYDKNDPYYGLTTVFSVSEVRKLIESKTDIKLSDDIKNWFVIDSIYSRRHVANVSIDGHSSCYMNGSNVNITGKTLISIFGLQTNSIEIEYKDGNFIFTTYGWGHGVGMSQWGAYYYAANGYTYDQILMHYYLYTALTVTYENERAVERGNNINRVQSSAEVSSDSEEALDVSAEISAGEN